MNIKNIKPTQDRLLVEREKITEVVTEGGIILTPGLKHEKYSPSRSAELVVEKEQEEEDNIYTAKVSEVGPDVKGVKKGDKIWMNKYAGIDIFKDRLSFLIKETDVLAIID